MKTQLTVKAFVEAYSGTSLFLVGEDVLPALVTLLGQDTRYLVLDADGLVYVPGEAADGLGARRVPVGMGIGIQGMLVGKRTHEAAQAWDAHSRKHKMFAHAPIKLLTGMKGRMGLDAARFMLDCKTRETHGLRAELGEREAGVSYLRRKNEGLLLNLEKARRMIRGAGFGLQQIAAELPIGEETVGPGGTVDTENFTQILPVDSSGLWAVALYAIPADETPVVGEGHLEAKILRASDRKCLAHATCDFRRFVDWFEFDLSEACGTTFGDAILEISWHGDLSRAPKLAFAAVDADRFGDGAGRTLAMRLMKGLADPVDTEAESGYSLSLLDRREVSTSDMLERAEWAFETLFDDHFIGSALLSYPDDRSWLQTHPAVDTPSGARIVGALTAGVAEASIAVVTDHEAGPECHYSLIAVEQLEGESASDRARKVLDFLSGKGDADPAGLHMARQLVSPGQRRRVRVYFDTPLKRSADLYMIVQVPGEGLDYAWCRWSDLEIGMSWPAADTVLAVNPEACVTSLRMRSLKFPELAGRIEFISGARKLDDLSKSLGFSPLLVSEETGSLQTHPLKDQMSAAIFPGGAPTNALRVASEVETAHDSAPAFLYVLAVMSPSVTEKERAIRNVLSRIDPQDHRTWQGVNSRKTVQWQAKTLYARKPATLEVELSLALEVPGDIVFAVKPVGEAVSYGWCRWYSLNITSAPEKLSGAGQAADG